LRDREHALADGAVTDRTSYTGRRFPRRPLRELKVSGINALRLNAVQQKSSYLFVALLVLSSSSLSSPSNPRALATCRLDGHECLLVLLVSLSFLFLVLTTEAVQHRGVCRDEVSESAYQ
jgi:hypothetical protein